ncbi:MAG: hypothetical protein IT292_09005 [Deltaproteobacteria bacterium]|nr:hypothetical protein [Deltaproteobacteria bacterium]
MQQGPTQANQYAITVYVGFLAHELQHAKQMQYLNGQNGDENLQKMFKINHQHYASAKQLIDENPGSNPYTEQPFERYANHSKYIVCSTLEDLFKGKR